MTDTNIWTSKESDIYRQLSAIAVPARADQIATLLSLLPFNKDDTFHTVELASGEGRLSHAILDAFPNATVLALDFEDSMRTETASRLAQFSGRGTVDAFDLTQSDWYPLMEGADVVVSSLCIHHLTAQGKQALFGAVQNHISNRGAFLIADLVMPQRIQAREVFQATWDKMAQQASIDLTGNEAVYQKFLDEHWNYYRYPDDFDKPSPLAHQLQWLTTAGFHEVDCFWMQAGHAIYGGYQSQAGEGGLPYHETFQTAKRALID